MEKRPEAETRKDEKDGEADQAPVIPEAGRDN